MELSIVIVNFNTQKMLKECLASIVANVTLKQAYEVIVVDNHSTDGSLNMVKTLFPQTHLIVNSKNQGFAVATNQAIRQSRGRYILLLNSDTLLLPEAVEKMISFFDENDAVGAVGCKTLNTDGSWQPSIYTFPRPLKDAVSVGLSGTNLKYNQKLRKSFNYVAGLLGVQFYTAESQTETRVVDYPQGACMMVRREVTENVGLLDEEFFFYGEEMDWCYRMKQQGWGVYYYPEATIIHHGRGASGHMMGKVFIQTRKSALRFYEKHYGWAVTEVMKILVSVVLLLKCGLYGVRYLFTGSDRAALLAQMEAQWSVVRLHYDQKFRALNVFSEMPFRYI